MFSHTHTNSPPDSFETYLNVCAELKPFHEEVHQGINSALARLDPAVLERVKPQVAALLKNATLKMAANIVAQIPRVEAKEVQCTGGREMGCQADAAEMENEVELVDMDEDDPEIIKVPAPNREVIPSGREGQEPNIPANPVNSSQNAVASTSVEKVDDILVSATAPDSTMDILENTSLVSEDTVPEKLPESSGNNVSDVPVEIRKNSVNMEVDFSDQKGHDSTLVDAIIPEGGYSVLVKINENAVEAISDSSAEATAPEGDNSGHEKGNDNAEAVHSGSTVEATVPVGANSDPVEVNPIHNQEMIPDVPKQPENPASDDDDQPMASGSTERRKSIIQSSVSGRNHRFRTLPSSTMTNDDQEVIEVDSDKSDDSYFTAISEQDLQPSLSLEPVNGPRRPRPRQQQHRMESEESAEEVPEIQPPEPQNFGFGLVGSLLSSVASRQLGVIIGLVDPNQDMMNHRVDIAEVTDQDITEAKEDDSAAEDVDNIIEAKKDEDDIADMIDVNDEVSILEKEEEKDDVDMSDDSGKEEEADELPAKKARIVPEEPQQDSDATEIASPIKEKNMRSSSVPHSVRAFGLSIIRKSTASPSKRSSSVGAVPRQSSRRSSGASSSSSRSSSVSKPPPQKKQMMNEAIVVDSDSDSDIGEKTFVCQYEDCGYIHRVLGSMIRHIRLKHRMPAKDVSKEEVLEYCHVIYR